MSQHNKIFFPPEWYRQDAILLAWPNTKTDWRYNLEDVVLTYQKIIDAILEFEKVVILCHDEKEVKRKLVRSNHKNLIFFEIGYNDTWTRDYGPVTIVDDNLMKMIDFRFNGWGNKYKADLDNSVTQTLFPSGIFHENVHLQDSQHLILEGGSIDTDGKGTLLTTEKSLLSESRNYNFSKHEIEEELKKLLGIQNILWLKHGQIIGDDTDGHIDLLAKFCNENTIVYVSPNKEDKELQRMKDELKQFRNCDEKSYELVSLPLPNAIYNKKGERLPATYINFLITNEAVLVPSYQDKCDFEVKEKLGFIFKQKEVILIDCLPLIQQRGALHCITMQLPKGTLKN